MKVDIRKIRTKLGRGKIDWSKFDKKKLFKSGIVRFLGLSTLTIVICVFVLGLIRANQEQKREVKKEEEGVEIKIKPTREVITTEELWKDAIETNLKKQSARVEEKIEEIKKDLEGIRNKKPNDDEAIILGDKVENLMKELNEIKNREEVKEGPKVKSNEINQYTLRLENAQNAEGYKALKTVENYIAAGSFAKAVLLSGVDATTSLNASSDPDPVLIRIVEHGTLPRKFKSDLKDCHIIGAAYGDLSSERAKVRLEKLSCTEISTAEIVETEIAGYVTGEDGRSGIRGEIVSTEGKLLGNSLVAGVLGGFANNFNTSTGNQPAAIFTDKVKQQGTSERIKDSLSSGGTSSLDRLSKYYIERAESLQPIVQVGAGRKVDVIFTEGVFFGNSEIRKAIGKKRDENIRNKANTSVNDTSTNGTSALIQQIE